MPLGPGGRSPRTRPSRPPAILEIVGLRALRAEARGNEGDDPMEFTFNGGADRFFYKGENGRWRDLLTEEDLAVYDEATATLDPSLRQWLEHGRAAVGLSF